MTREKMHKEMVPPGGIFMRSTCGSFVGIGENCVENAGKYLQSLRQYQQKWSEKTGRQFSGKH